MLEQRLLARPKGVSSIEKIVIEGHVPSYLMKLLVAILKGYICERPPNHGLSVQANMITLPDAAIPGCFKCHPQLVECQLPIKLATPEKWEAFRPTEHSQVEYPKSTDEILSTWKVCRKVFEGLLEADEWGLGLRRRSCENRQVQEITRHMLVRVQTRAGTLSGGRHACGQ
ncbi:SubName: Full=Uncharacterized protein {ECO:0000313/EMBL:CCA73249.1} [Serendipita indica DSM 11827]|nr:SubName: Full=Uncharacterized protein {ECO:0000313/EMBL:CCA73249.1} [Serendipita indica DSM 11827]